MAVIYLLEVYDGNACVHQRAFSTREWAFRELAAWCRAQWERQHDPKGEDDYEALSEDDEKAVRSYFEYWTPEEEFYVEKLEVDAGEEKE